MPVQYRAGAVAAVAGVTQTFLDITVPASVQPGDVMRLGYIAKSATGDAGGQAVVSAPSGGSGGSWTAFGTQQNQAVAVAQCWWKLAAAGDAGATVTLTYTVDTTQVQQKAVVDAWSGVDPADPVPAVAQGTDANVVNTWTMPTVDTTGVWQCWASSLFMGRGGASSPSVWTVPSGWTVRQAQAVGGATNTVTASLDTAAAVPAAPGQGGAVLSADANSVASFYYSMAVRPWGVIIAAPGPRGGG